MFRAPARSTTAAVALATAAVLAVSGCSVSGHPGAEPGSPDASESPATSIATIKVNVRRNADSVNVDRTIKVDVSDGQLQKVSLRGPGGRVPGEFGDDSSHWNATALLRADARYTVRGVAVDDNGLRKHFQRRFSTQKLTLDEQTYPSFVPLDGATVGIAMPVIIRFDVPVTDKASIERHLSVESKPAQAGAWHWLSDNEVHWRPRKYWTPGTDVTVHADIGSVPAGNGIYGQLDREMTFHIGRGQITRVDLDSHQMKVFRGGKLIRTMPTTGGEEPKYTTRSGTKVIVAKDRYHDMNSETIGIDPESADGYDLEDVEFAMRLTYSGEFIHAAPWSVGSQGQANVSHGCTGLSTANAGWLYQNSLIGDPVEYSGTDRMMTLENGYGDWNLPFPQYKEGSAL
jgi:lipoprotein-anchoring transpeptidase ErfK/SrfK